MYFHKGIKDTISNQLTVRNCSFYDIPACIIRINANGAEKIINKVLVENNYVDGIAHHLFQFAGKNIGLADFAFRENVVKNMYATGGQFFNTHISPAHPATDSIYHFTVEHNTFYKIGGCASSARKFIECTDANNWSEVYFDVNNNIFWDRYSWESFAESNVTLFTADTTKQKVEFNFLNNVVYPVNAYANDALDAPKDTISFPVDAGNITPTFANIFLTEDEVANFWADTAALTIYKSSKFYTAGVNKTYIGAAASYVNDPIIPLFPRNTVYAWESPEGKAFEQGGKAEHYNADGLQNQRINYAQAGYYTLSVNGKKDLSTDYILVTLDEALAEGDVITITGFRNKNAAGKTSNAYFVFSNGTTCNDGTDGTYYTNINNEGGVDFDEDGETPNTVSFTIPAAAAGSTSFQLTREKTGTNLFITRFVITRALAPKTVWDFTDILPADTLDYDAATSNLVNSYNSDPTTWGQLSNSVALDTCEVMINATTAFEPARGLKFACDGNKQVMFRCYPEEYGGFHFYSNNNSVKVFIPAEAGKDVVLTAKADNEITIEALAGAKTNGKNSLEKGGAYEEIRFEATDAEVVLSLPKKLYIQKIEIAEHQAVEALNKVEIEATGVIYDIYGRRVFDTVEGQLYIQDGKKFIGK